MLRKTENAIEFKNGNINIRFTPENISDIHADKIQNSGLYTLINILDWIDCYFVGYGFCLGNGSMGQLVYNAHSNVCYILDISDIDYVLMDGRTLKLYAHKPSADEREQIAREIGVNA